MLQSVIVWSRSIRSQNPHTKRRKGGSSDQLCWPTKCVVMEGKFVADWWWNQSSSVAEKKVADHLVVKPSKDGQPHIHLGSLYHMVELGTASSNYRSLQTYLLLLQTQLNQLQKNRTRAMAPPLHLMKSVYYRHAQTQEPTRTHQGN